MTTADILQLLQNVKNHGSYWTARCPAHDDQKNSLSIQEGNLGVTLVKCHAGCEFDAIRIALNLEAGDFFVDDKRQIGEEVDRYPYRDKDGKILYYTVRYWPKDFRALKPDGTKGLNGIPTVLYRLDQITTRLDELVYVVEGEKDVHTLEQWGLLATTNPFGASRWLPAYADSLVGRDVIVIPDNDPKGEEHIRVIEASLKGKAKSVSVLRLPNLTHKQDVSDWVRKGGTLQEFSKLVDQAQKKSAPGLTYISLTGSPPPMEWLIDGWLAKGDVGLLAGQAFAGKSTTAADLAVAIAGGRNGSGWLGMKINITGPVLYLDEEAGKDEVHRLFGRLGAAGDNSLQNLHVSSCVGLSLKNDQSLERITYDIKTIQPALVIFDSISHFFGGANENSAEEVVSMFKVLFKLREEHNTTFLAIHHLRKPSQQPTDGEDPLNQVRGSTAFTTQSSVVWNATPNRISGTVDLYMSKRRGGERASVKVKQEKDKDQIRLIPVGEADTAQNAMDTCVRFIILTLQISDQELWPTAQIVSECVKNGHGERNAKAAVSYCYASGILVKKKHGIYHLDPHLKGKHTEQLEM